VDDSVAGVCQREKLFELSDIHAIQLCERHLVLRNDARKIETHDIVPRFSKRIDDGGGRPSAGSRH
jgi:hypothetical protein